MVRLRALTSQGWSLMFLPPGRPQVQSMKQTNSSLRQALEGGIDPLRPPEVRVS